MTAARPSPLPEVAAGEDQPLTAEERRLRRLLKVLAGLFLLGMLVYLVPAFLPSTRAAFIQLPFVTNSVVKVGVLGLLAFFAAADPRRQALLTRLVIAGHLVSIAAVLAVLLLGDTAGTLQGSSLPLRPVLYGSVLLDGAIVIVLGLAYRAAEQARWQLRFFTPLQFRVLTALSEVVILGEEEVLTAAEVARNVDRYLADFRGRGKWISRLALLTIHLLPLVHLHAPFAYLPPLERRDFIRRQFYGTAGFKLLPASWREAIQAAIRMGQQLCYLGYYGDQRTHPTINYVPFSRRPSTAERLAESPVKERLPLSVRTSASVAGDELEGDVVVIGSGAAGAVLAHGLAAKGRRVLMLERGDYVDPSRFSEDEIEMLSRLYADGALQLTRDFKLQVLQGSCVGGTTVVNNAVCFDLPPPVLARWNDPREFDARLDERTLEASFRRLRGLLHVQPQAREDRLNPGATAFTNGIRRLGLDRAPNRYQVVEANIEDCLGCGYCNVGCGYGKKLSMLDTVLPQTQQEFGVDSLVIYAGCEALKLQGRGRRIDAVDCRFSDQKRVRVRARTFVVAAGAISSSLLLQRSSIGGRRAGRNVSFNLGSPLTAVLEAPVRAYEGLQISHYLERVPEPGYIIETWFNPPVAQALAMPGWFEDHYANMRRYDHLTCAGVLVGTESNATVSPGRFTGRDIGYQPTPGDVRKLVDGLLLTGEVFFAGGARRVLPHTLAYHEFSSVEELRRLPEILERTSLTMGTGHPQGGNLVSANPQVGVVGPDFRAHGYDNLFVCDASVFPTSIGVNPQLTVMALADYAVPFVAATH